MTTAIMKQAYQHCIKHRHRFTQPRANVLEVLAHAEKPLGAYDILQRLSDADTKPKPPTIYRAIQFWQQEGFIHCIDSLKAYVACGRGHHTGHVQFLICNQCDHAEEIFCHLDCAAIYETAANHQFKVQSTTLEIKGVCIQCVANAPS